VRINNTEIYFNGCYWKLDVVPDTWRFVRIFFNSGVPSHRVGIVFPLGISIIAIKYVAQSRRGELLSLSIVSVEGSRDISVLLLSHRPTQLIISYIASVALAKSNWALLLSHPSKCQSHQSKRQRTDQYYHTHWSTRLSISAIASVAVVRRNWALLLSHRSKCQSHRSKRQGTDQYWYHTKGLIIIAITLDNEGIGRLWKKLLDFPVALCIANEHMAIAVASLLFLGDWEIIRQS
jgi:hypothetical protein